MELDVYVPLKVNSIANPATNFPLKCCQPIFPLTMLTEIGLSISFNISQLTLFQTILLFYLFKYILNYQMAIPNTEYNYTPHLFKGKRYKPWDNFYRIFIWSFIRGFLP